MNDQADTDARLPVLVKRETIIVSSDVHVLDTGIFEQMQRIAKIMSATGLVPEHLNRRFGTGANARNIEPEEAFANCFLVVDQAVRWRMDPFAVAQSTYVARGRLGFEGKLIAAVINTHPQLEKRLSYRYAGEKGKEDRAVIVKGRIRGDEEDREIEGTVAQWQTRDKDGVISESWRKSPEQMLAYRGAREWARRWMPEAILGVLADDELETIPPANVEFADTKPATGTAALRAAAERAAERVNAGVQEPAQAMPQETKPQGPEPTLLAWKDALDGCHTAEDVASTAADAPELIRNDPEFGKVVRARLDAVSKKVKK